MTPVERAKECIYDRFEQKWFKNPDYRLEDHLPLIPSLAQKFGVDGNQADFKISVHSELIRIEINLRRGAGTGVMRFEYRKRFPEFDDYRQIAQDYHVTN